MARMNLKKLAAVGALLAACGAGQTTFTVSSVKPSQSGKSKGDLSTSPVMLTIRNLPLDLIIAAAYGIAGCQISGLGCYAMSGSISSPRPMPRSLVKMKCGPCCKVCWLSVFG